MSTPAASTVDVTGLPPEAVRQVQQLADALRAVHAPPAHRPTETPEERVAQFNAWVDSHVSRNPNFDDSRDSIYD